MSDTRHLHTIRAMRAADIVTKYSAAAEASAWRIIVLIAVTIIIWIGFHFWTGVFITPRNLSNLSVQMTVIGLLAAGMTWLLVAREIDLSVGSLLAVIAVLMMQLMVKLGWATLLAIPVVLLVGIAIGLIQGSLRVWLGIPSFIVTLAGFSWLRGSAYVISGAETISGGPNLFYSLANGSIPPSISLVIISLAAVLGMGLWLRRYTNLLGPQLRSRRLVSIALLLIGLGTALVTIWVFGFGKGIPYPLALLAIAFFVMEFVSRNTSFGRNIYAIGGNPESARRAGVNINAVILALFAIMGGLAALAGILQASRLDAGPPNLGVFLPLETISAAIVGGTSLFGGIGTVTGAILGALLMTSITNGLSLAGVNTFYQMIITGILLLLAVSFDMATQRRSK